MKTFVNILIFLSFFSLLLSCNLKKEGNDNKLYEQKASVFISQIFSTKDFECSYIVKPDPKYNLLEIIEIEQPYRNYQSRFIKILKVNSSESLDSLLDLSENFEYNGSMFKNKIKLIDINEFKLISKKQDSIFNFGTDLEKEKLFSKCPSHFYFISKPVFDKEYKTAIIDIQHGRTCVGTGPRTYKLDNNGKWK